MAITGNSSTEKTVREKSTFTGLAECKVLAVNPNKQELEAIGITRDENPQYIGEDGRVRLDFWIQTQNEDSVKTKFSLWMTNEVGNSEAGNTQYINNYGKTAWYSGECPYDWYLTDGVREALKGEQDLHEFLAAFLNTKYDTRNKVYDECIIDNPQAIFKGDYSELKSIINNPLFKENTVRLLFGAKVTEEGNVYQNVYNKFFERTCVNANHKRWFEKAVTADYGTFNADFQNDLTWKPYVPTIGDVPTADVETSSEETTEDAF